MVKKLSKEEFVELYKNHLIHKKKRDNIVYKRYKRYRKLNYKKIMGSYFASKYRDKALSIN